MPRNVRFEEAASIVLTGTSAWEAIYQDMKVQPRQTVLIHGGAGGIGTSAIKMAKHIGAFVSTTASTERLTHVKQLGPHHAYGSPKKELTELPTACQTVRRSVRGTNSYQPNAS